MGNPEAVLILVMEGESGTIWDGTELLSLFSASAHLPLSLIGSAFSRLPEAAGFLGVWFTGYLHRNFL